MAPTESTARPARLGEPPRAHNPALDGLRGVAILVSYHLYEKPFLAGKARFTDQQAIPRPGLLRRGEMRSAANSHARVESREDA